MTTRADQAIEAASLRLIEQSRILASHQRDLVMSASKKVADQIDALCDEVIRLRANLPRPLEVAAGVADAVEEMRARKDAAYLERNQVVAALTRCYPSGLAKTAIEGWSEDWHGCVYIDLPTGQVSWHFHDSQAYLFDGLPPYAGTWDGHDTPEKYRRLSSLATHPGGAGCSVNAGGEITAQFIRAVEGPKPSSHSAVAETKGVQGAEPVANLRRLITSYANAFYVKNPERAEAIYDKIDAILTGLATPAASVPLVGGEAQTLQDGFREGWKAAAAWADRYDLYDDVGSPAYLKVMAAALSPILAQDAEGAGSDSVHLGSGASGGVQGLEQADTPTQKALAEVRATINRFKGLKWVTITPDDLAFVVADRDAMEKDAMRYQWLRDKSQDRDSFYLSVPKYLHGVKFTRKTVDDAIDAAILASNPPAPAVDGRKG